MIQVSPEILYYSVFKYDLAVRFARPDDIEKLGHIKARQFKNCKEFTLKDEGLLIKQSGIVYIIEEPNSGKIIATMQVELFESLNTFLGFYSNYYNYRVIPTPNLFPSFYLSKAATEDGYRKIGLNSYLRLLIINLAIAHPEVRSLTGVVYEEASRVKLMKKIGYKSLPITTKDENYVRPSVNQYFMCLDKSHFYSAKNYLEEEILDLKNRFKIKNYLA